MQIMASLQFDLLQFDSRRRPLTLRILGGRLREVLTVFQCFITYKKNMNKVENPTLGLVFLTNFDMIDIAMKHCYERVFGKKTK